VLSSSLYPHVFVGLIMYTIVRKFQFSTEKEPSGTNGPRSQNTSCLFMVREHRGDTASSGKYGGRCMFCEPLVKKYQYVRFMCVAGGAWSFQSSMHHPQAPALTHPFCAKHHVCIAGRRGSPRSRDSGAQDQQHHQQHRSRSRRHQILLLLPTPPTKKPTRDWKQISSAPRG